MTLYPNLLAEYEAGNGGHICTFCEYANVTEELMRAVFYDGEDLELDEAIALTRLLGCGVNYLFSPRLSYFKRLAECQQLVKSTISCCVATRNMQLDSFGSSCLDKALRATEIILTKEPLTCAYYRAAERGLMFIENILRPKQPRGLKHQDTYEVV